jgi:hypothetical protein
MPANERIYPMRLFSNSLVTYLRALRAVFETGSYRRSLLLRALSTVCHTGRRVYLALLAMVASCSASVPQLKYSTLLCRTVLEHLRRSFSGSFR